MEKHRVSAGRRRGISPSVLVAILILLVEGFERLPADRKAIHAVEQPRSLSPHVLTGDILAPDETEPTVELIVEFLKAA